MIEVGAKKESGRERVCAPGQGVNKELLKCRLYLL